MIVIVIKPPNIIPFCPLNAYILKTSRELDQELIRMTHLSIRNIWVKSVDHTKKTGCKMAERLQLRARGVKRIRNSRRFKHPHNCWDLVRFVPCEEARGPYLRCIVRQIIL